MNKIKIYLILLALLIAAESTYSQLPSLAVAGGPTIGIHMPKIDNLNNSLKIFGFSELPDNHLTMGGQGFLDISFDEWGGYLRFTGYGNGFSTKKTNVTDTITRTVELGMGVGGIGAEYVMDITSIFDVTAGLMLSLGSMTLDMYQYSPTHGNWTEWNQTNDFAESFSTTNVTRNYKVSFYSAQPQIGVGLLLTGFMYLKLNAGYMLSAQGTWKVDDDIEVRNMPTGIKADGFNVNLGLNFGLFFRD